MIKLTQMLIELISVIKQGLITDLTRVIYHRNGIGRQRGLFNKQLMHQLTLRIRCPGIIIIMYQNIMNVVVNNTKLT